MNTAEVGSYTLNWRSKYICIDSSKSLLNHPNSFEDWVLADGIYWYPLSKELQGNNKLIECQPIYAVPLFSTIITIVKMPFSY